MSNIPDPKIFKGKIVSHATDKTAVVEVSRMSKHPKYGKFIRRTKRLKAHDEKNEYKEGESVLIRGSRPISKDKHFIIIGRA